jgi:hypothetical protein
VTFWVDVASVRRLGNRGSWQNPCAWLILRLYWVELSRAVDACRYDCMGVVHLGASLRWYQRHGFAQELAKIVADAKESNNSPSLGHQRSKYL